MIASLAWLLEFLLESSGAYFAFRKRLKLLSALLAWRAFADILTFAVMLIIRRRLGGHHYGDAYGICLWISRAVQYAILYALGIQLAAKMVKDYRPITQYVYKIWAVAASVCAYVFVTTELFAHKFARAEAITSFLLLAVVLLGWIGRKKGLEEPWKLITGGVIVGAAGNALCAIMATSTNLGLKFYPIPAIAALLIWNWSVLPRKTRRLLQFRSNLPPKMEPTGVYVEPKSQRFVM